MGDLCFYTGFTASSLDFYTLYFFDLDLLLLFLGLALPFSNLFLSTSILFLAIFMVFTIDIDLPIRLTSTVFTFLTGSVFVLMVLLLPMLSLLRLV